MSYAFVDTGAWYAILDKNDKNHESAKQFKNLSQDLFVTSNYVVGETITLIASKLSKSIAIDFGQELWDESFSKLIRVTKTDEKNAWKLFVKYIDKGFSFTDCTSFVLMERLGITTAFAFDKHFAILKKIIIWIGLSR